MLPEGTLAYAAEIRRSLIAGRVRASKNSKIVLPFNHYPTDLCGACGLASVLLCLALGDTELKYLKGTSGHAWNVFPFPCSEKQMIVDITATQFRAHDFICLESGVYMGVRPQPFHRLAYYNDRVFRQGRDMLEYINHDDWYVEPRLGATFGEILRWRKACRALVAASPVPMARLAKRA